MAAESVTVLSKRQRPPKKKPIIITTIAVTATHIIFYFILHLSSCAFIFRACSLYSLSPLLPSPSSSHLYHFFSVVVEKTLSAIRLCSVVSLSLFHSRTHFNALSTFISLLRTCSMRFILITICLYRLLTKRNK